MVLGTKQTCRGCGRDWVLEMGEWVPACRCETCPRCSTTFLSDDPARPSAIRRPARSDLCGRCEDREIEIEMETQRHHEGWWRGQGRWR